MHPFRLLFGALGLTAAAAASCSGSRSARLAPPAPVSSADRAAARADRAARRQARAEQPKIVLPRPPPPPPPKAPPPPTASASAAPSASAIASAPAPATPVASASAATSAAPPPDFCAELCRRTMECAIERIGHGPHFGRDMQDMLRQHMREAEKSCRGQCESMAGAKKVARARECLEEKSCDAFLDCINRVKAEERQR